MTRNGHWIAGGSIALILAAAGHYWEAIGTLAGANAPDTLELSYRKRSGDGSKAWHYGRVIPHRTLTHWWPLWGAVITANYHIVPHIPIALTVAGHAIAVGVIAQKLIWGVVAGVVTHLVMDFLTPMGIPLKTPFGKRSRWSLIRTGGSEYLVLFPMIGISMSYALWHWLPIDMATVQRMATL